MRNMLQRTTEDRPPVLVSAEEQAQIVRTLRQWLNGAEPVQATGLTMDYEYLPENRGITMATEQAACKQAQYITGGYRAEYLFRIVLRDIAEDADERITMDETLDKIGTWAETNTPPDFGDSITVRTIQRMTTAGIYARYEDGTEDHQLTISMIYEVI